MYYTSGIINSPRTACSLLTSRRRYYTCHWSPLKNHTRDLLSTYFLIINRKSQERQSIISKANYCTGKTQSIIVMSSKASLLNSGITSSSKPKKKSKSTGVDLRSRVRSTSKGRTRSNKSKSIRSISPPRSPRHKAKSVLSVSTHGKPSKSSFLKDDDDGNNDHTTTIKAGEKIKFTKSPLKKKKDSSSSSTTPRKSRSERSVSPKRRTKGERSKSPISKKGSSTKSSTGSRSKKKNDQQSNGSTAMDTILGVSASSERSRSQSPIRSPKKSSSTGGGGKPTLSLSLHGRPPTGSSKSPILSSKSLPKRPTTKDRLQRNTSAPASSSPTRQRMKSSSTKNNTKKLSRHESYSSVSTSGSTNDTVSKGSLVSEFNKCTWCEEHPIEYEGDPCGCPIFCKKCAMKFSGGSLPVEEKGICAKCHQRFWGIRRKGAKKAEQQIREHMKTVTTSLSSASSGGDSD